MLIYNKFSLIYALILYCIVFLSSCGTPDEYKETHLQRGILYIENGDYDKARVEFKNVLRIDPKSAETYTLLAQTEEHHENWQKAVDYYHKAIELAPGNLEPYIGLGRFYLKQAASAKALGKKDIEAKYLLYAKEQVDAAIKIELENIDTIVLNASLLAYQGNNDEAIDNLITSHKLNQKNSESIILLSRIYSHKKLYQDTEKLLKDALTDFPDDVDIHIELASLYINRKQFYKTTEVIKKVITLEPESFDHRLSLASYYLLQQNISKADEVYRQAIKEQPGDIKRYVAYTYFIKKQHGLVAAIDYLEKINEDIRDTDKVLSFVLSSLYQEAKDDNKSISLLNDIIKSEKLNLAGIRARKILASVYFSKNDINNAKRFIEQVLSENPNDHEIIILKGKLAVQEQKYNIATSLFRSALKNQPDSIEILQLLAGTHLLNGENELASELLKQVLRKDPDDINSRLELARLMLASNENAQALEHVNRVLQGSPGNINAITLKSDILIKQKEIQEVISLLNHLKIIAPDNAEGWFRMGRIYKHRNQKEQARQEFISAYNRAPDSIDLLAELTDIEIELGEINATKQRLKNILKEQQDHPSAHMFLGMAYLAEKQPDKAEKEFILHLQQTPDDVTAFLQLGNIHYSKKNINHAAEYFLRGYKVDPKNTDILLSLAHLRSIQKNDNAAIALYQQVLAIQPDNAVVTNNLAMILANNKSDTGNLKRAKDLILNSKRKSHPALQDTLGWVYYNLGDYDNAHLALIKAVSQAPNIPTFHYHMGMVYIKKNDEDLARKHLQTAMSLGNFPERIEASRELELLKK